MRLLKILLVLCLLIVGCSDKKKPTPGVEDVTKYNIAGRAPYAIQLSNYNCDSFIQSVKSKGVNDFRYSWLYRTFDNKGDGSNLDCVRKLNALPETTFMEVHLINEVCQRNKRCGPYEFLANMTVSDYQNKLKRKDRALLAKIDNYVKEAAARILPTLPAKVRCAVSVGLESNLDSSAGQTITEIGRKHFGGRCQMVWNPLKGSPIPNTIFEQHGSHPNLQAPCIVNLDGEDINFNFRPSKSSTKINEKDVPAYVERYQHCDVFVWAAEDNCIHPDFVDPRKRSNCPSQQMNDALSGFLKIPKGGTVPGTPNNPGPTPPAGKPASCGNVKQFKTGESLWKPASTDTHDNREGKPAVIFKSLKPRTKKLKIRDVKNNEVGALSYFGDFRGNGSRFYTGHWGGSNDTSQSIFDKAKSKSGSPFVWIEVDGGTCYGPVNPNERAGDV